MNSSTPIRLTQTVQKGGCAAKIAAHVLKDVLSGVNFNITDPDILVDGSDFDDAGIVRINDSVALVQTLDFFTPIVDSPDKFGAIAAANALSDVYAMGGVPKSAMAILAFPLATLDPMLMRDILEGANKKIIESKASLVGGHSIDDDTLKFGLSVTGLVNPQEMWTNKGLKLGDKLLLTKPLGTGTLTAGLKKSVYSEADIDDAIVSMMTLNDVISLLPPSLKSKIHGGTDITGFGLLGHTMQMAKASQQSIHLDFEKLPVFKLAFESLKNENLTKAHRTNKEYTFNQIQICNLEKFQEQILFDPQTSGGLLLSIAADAADEIEKIIKQKFKFATLIGEVKAPTDKYVWVN